MGCYEHPFSPDHGDEELAAKGCQIFAGAAFLAMIVCLLLGNRERLSFYRDASLEYRLRLATHISTFMSMASAALNFFQATDFDDLLLPRSDSFVLDGSRPLEWLLTCPMMQVVLVILAGKKIPQYYWYLQPGLSALVITIGTSGLALDSFDGAKLGCFVVGACTALTMFSFNRRMIILVSDGAEGFSRGFSEFRRLTLVLIGTWLPFPMWFALTPEGMGVVTSKPAVIMGWSVLNIIAKFSFIIGIQRWRVKHLKEVRRKTSTMFGGAGMFSTSGTMDDSGGMLRSKSLTFDQYQLPEDEDGTELQPLDKIVTDTLIFLGFSGKSEKFMKLLKARLHVTTAAELVHVTPQACVEARLPWEILYAMQRHVSVPATKPLVVDSDMATTLREASAASAGPNGCHDDMMVRAASAPAKASASESLAGDSAPVAPARPTPGNGSTEAASAHTPEPPLTARKPASPDEPAAPAEPAAEGTAATVAASAKSEESASTQPVPSVAAPMSEPAVAQPSVVQQFFKKQLRSLCALHPVEVTGALLKEVMHAAEAAGLPPSSEEFALARTRVVQLEEEARETNALLAEADGHLKANHWEKADASFTRVLQSKPNCFDAYAGRVAVHRRMHNWVQVEADAAKMLQLRPLSHTGRHARAHALYRLRRLEQAKEECEQGLKDHPSSMLLKRLRRTVRHELEVPDDVVELEAQVSMQSAGSTARYTSNGVSLDEVMELMEEEYIDVSGIREGVGSEPLVSEEASYAETMPASDC